MFLFEFFVQLHGGYYIRAYLILGLYWYSPNRVETRVDDILYFDDQENGNSRKTHLIFH